jgi:hypothetical protein
VPCHQQRAFTDRSNGRIYKLSYQGAKPAQVDLTKATDAELVELQLHANDWYVRTARRVLAERGSKPEVHAGLVKILADNPMTRGSCAPFGRLHCTGGLTEAIALEGSRA